MNTAGVLPNRVDDDLRSRAGIYANALVWATAFAFPIIGLVDFLILDEFGKMAFALRVVTSLILFLVFQLTKRKGWHPNVPVNTAYTLLHVVMAFELYVVGQAFASYVFYQIIAVVIIYNAVALWSIKEALIQYIIGTGLAVMLYLLGSGSGFEAFLVKGGGLLFLTVIIPLTLPSAKFSANRLTSRKTLQLQQTLNELKLKNQELQQAKEALKRFEKKDSNRIRVAIHDLNNRISSMEYLAELMQLKYADHNVPDLKKYLGKMNDIVKEIKVFTSNVLTPTTTRTEKSKSDIKMSMTFVQLQPIINTILMDLEPEADRKNVIIHQVSPKEEVFLHADEVYLTTALRNMIRYALKFSQDDNQIIVSTNIKFGKVYIEIMDRTRGVTQSTLDMLFNKLPEAYSEAEADKKETQGIGLSVSKYLVEQMNGRIDYESSIELGLQFTIIFDLAEPTTTQDD